MKLKQFMSKLKYQLANILNTSQGFKQKKVVILTTTFLQ